MRIRIRVITFWALLAVFAAIILLKARHERGDHMDTNPAPVAGRMTLNLPRPETESTTSIEKALNKRRSQREYGKGPLSIREVSRLLWAAQGATHGNGRRTAPSAGALYPLETYLVAGNIQGLPAGVYRYIPRRHVLDLLVSGDVRRRLREASIHQDAVNSAPACIVFSAVYGRSTAKYGERGIRYTHIEAGAAAQNVALQAVSLHLGTFVIGAFRDDDVKKVLSLSEAEEPLIIMPVGRMRAAASGL